MEHSFEISNIISTFRHSYVTECRIQAMKLKLKCTLVQGLRLCTGRTAHRGSRGIALPFHDHGTRRGWGVSVTPRPLFTPGKNPVPIVQEAGWAPGPVWRDAENLAPPGFDPRTVQPVASRYTDYATRPTFKRWSSMKCDCVLVTSTDRRLSFKNWTYVPDHILAK